MPRLWVSGARTDFGAQLASIIFGGAVGALVYTQDMGIWGKVERVPRWLRILFVVGMCGFFFLVPMAILGIAIVAGINGDAKTIGACTLARQWIQGGGLLQLILGLLVQASAVAVYGVDLWMSIAVGFVLLVKVAAEHDTHEHVYLRLMYREGRALGRDVADEATWEESTPLITGPLDSLLQPRGLLVLLFRALEVVASVGSAAVFQAGTRDTLVVGNFGIGGLLFVAAQMAAQAGVFRMSSEWMSAGFMRASLACVFIPKPALDSEVPVLLHYAIMAVAQVIALSVDFLLAPQTELPGMAHQGIRLAALAMWPLLLTLRLKLAVRSNSPVGAAELAEKVKLGVVQLQPLQADLAQLAQLEDFCRAFCNLFFDKAFVSNGDSATLDLSGTTLEVSAICMAMVFAMPLLKDVSKYELNLEGTHLRDADVADLVEHLPMEISSLEVNLAGTQVGDVGVVRLAQMLPRGLTRLEAGLNSTQITDKGLTVLAQQLPDTLSSLELILYNTQVGDKGITALAKKLPPNLISLRAGLYRTPVGDEGVTAMAQNLPDCLQVFKIELAGTQVGDAGASALAENLPEKIMTLEANLSNTKVSDEVKQLVKEAASAPTFRGRDKAKDVLQEGSDEPPTYCCRLLPFWNP